MKDKQWGHLRQIQIIEKSLVQQEATLEKYVCKIKIVYY
jgi:hypothetical protein